MRPSLEVADIFRQHGHDFRLTPPLSPEQRRVMRAIERCRTAALGGQVEQCDTCGHQRISYNSCRNRHCPKCQSLAKARWLVAGAEQAFKKGVETAPDGSLAYWCLADFYEAQDRIREAGLFYEEAVRRDPNDAEANKRFGKYLRSIGDYTRAKEYLERAYSLIHPIRK